MGISAVVVYGLPGKQDLGPEVATPESGTEGSIQEQWRSGQRRCGVAERRAKPALPAALHLPVPEKFKLSNG